MAGFQISRRRSAEEWGAIMQAVSAQSMKHVKLISAILPSETFQPESTIPFAHWMNREPGPLIPVPGERPWAVK